MGKSVGVLGTVGGQVAEALDFVGGKAPCAVGRVKVRIRGRVFLTVGKTWTGGSR